MTSLPRGGAALSKGSSYLSNRFLNLRSPRSSAVMTNPDGMSSHYGVLSSPREAAEPLGGFGSADSAPSEQRSMPPIETFVGKLGDKLTEIHLIDIERPVLVLLLCPLCVCVSVCPSLSVCLSLTLPLSLSPSFPLPVSHCFSLMLVLPPFLSLSLSGYQPSGSFLTLALSLSLSLLVSCALLVCACLSFNLCVCVCVCVCVWN